jgi:hypothetical protein
MRLYVLCSRTGKHNDIPYLLSTTGRGADSALVEAHVRLLPLELVLISACARQERSDMSLTPLNDESLPPLSSSSSSLILGLQ